MYLEYDAMKKYVGMKVVNIVDLGMAVSGVIDVQYHQHLSLWKEM